MTSVETDAGEEAAEARSAATVILLRDSDEGPQVFMIERHRKSRFVGGAHVFPGGRVDPEDSHAEELCIGLDDRQASSRLHLESGGLAYYVAAIRECFEEAGVLLAYDGEGRLLDAAEPATAARLDDQRQALNGGRVDFLELAAKESWKLASDRMHYWAHWITPEKSPIRFDTRFFLATMPQSQAARPDDGELTDSAWVTPKEALAKAERKEWNIIFPTLRNLMTLSDFSSTGKAEAAGLRRREIETIQPRMVHREGGLQAVLPGDDGWDEEAAG